MSVYETAREWMCFFHSVNRKAPTSGIRATAELCKGSDKKRCFLDMYG